MQQNIQRAEIEEKKRLSFTKEKEAIYLGIKYLFDALLSVIGLIILSPLLLITSIAIKIETPGSVFYSQNRVGKDGRLFKMYKFRSMVDNADKLKKKLMDRNEMSGPMFKMKEDPRVTKVGKFIRRTSIDELPQLINIIKGDMSLVGPRPSLPEEVKQFEPWMKERFKVRPGLTCFWQVRGRNDIGFEDWMKMDIEYIRKRNTILDIKLIIKTFFVLFGDKHAC